MGSRKLVLITGGVRSGKSAFAERLAKEMAGPTLYVATAAVRDEEMRRRVEEHRRRRPENWQTLEAEFGVGRSITQNAGNAEVVLVECLALLVSNLTMGSGYEIDEDDLDEAALEEKVREEVKDILSAYRSLPASFIVVSNEVGFGLVPPFKSGRIYRDLLGRANQLVAAEADEVYLVVAGIPVELKRLGGSKSPSP